MGLRMFGSSCSAPVDRIVYVDRPVPAPKVKGNPDPRKFTVKSATQVGDHVVAVVVYPDAFNYEGTKVLLYKDITVEKLRGQVYLDPHFCEHDEHLSPFARFAPTDEGIVAASILAHSL